MANKITTLFDLDSRGFDTGLKGLRKEIAATDGAFSKMKVGAAGAFASLKANAAAAAVGAGVALVAFGAKAVSSFTEGALAAGKFSQASGLAVEDASRWQEVAGDLGVSANTFAAGFVKLEKAIATGGPAVKELGIETKRTADGTADMNATMLDAIDRLGGIQDPAKRAKAATELFGRGFADMAEIILGDADDIQARLEGVGDAQVFDATEVAKAREFRDAMDDLSDSAERVSMAFGERLVPILTDAANTVAALIAKYDELKAKAESTPGGKGLWDTLLGTPVWEPFQQFDDEFEKLVVALGGAKTEVGALREQFNEMVAAGNESAGATVDAAEAVETHVAVEARLESQIKRTRDGIAGRIAATEKVTVADKDATDAARILADAYQDLADRTADRMRNLHAYDDAVRNTGDAQRELQEAEADYQDLLANGTVSLAERRRAMDDVADAQRDVRTATDNLTAAYAAQDQMVRDSIATDREKYDAVRKVEDAQRAVDDNIRSQEDALRGIQDADRAVLRAKERLARLRYQQSRPLPGGEIRTSDFAMNEQLEIEDAQRDVEDALRRVEDAHRRSEDAADDNVDANLRLSDAQEDQTRLFTQGTLTENQKTTALENIEDAQRDLNDAYAGLNEAIASQQQLEIDSIPTDDEKRIALEAVHDAQRNLSDAVYAQATAYADSRGAIDDTTESFRLQREELARLHQMYPDARADIESLQGILAGFVASRPQFNANGYSSFLGPHARGGTTSRGGIVLAGEQGPELIELPGGSKIHTAAATASMYSSAMPSPAGSAAAAGNLTVVLNVDGNLVHQSQLPRMLVDGLNAAKRSGIQLPWAS